MPEPKPLAFQPEAVLRALVANDVDFVVIGGVAAILHGAPLTTEDLDVVPLPSAENLTRVAQVLYELDAKLRREGEPEPLHRLSTGDWLRAGRFWNFVTRHGHFDLVFDPGGVEGYDDLAADALSVEVEGLPVRVASVERLIAMKEAAGRLKDEPGLRFLRAMADEDAEA